MTSVSFHAPNEFTIRVCVCMCVYAITICWRWRSGGGGGNSLGCRLGVLSLAVCLVMPWGVPAVFLLSLSVSLSPFLLKTSRSPTRPPGEWFSSPLLSTHSSLSLRTHKLILQNQITDFNRFRKYSKNIKKSFPNPRVWSQLTVCQSGNCATLDNIELNLSSLDNNGYSMRKY